MNARFMRERILTENRLIRLRSEGDKLRERLARVEELFRIDFRLEGKPVMARLHRHHDFLESRVPCSLSDAVDRTLDLACTCLYSRQRICHRETEIIVAVNADDGAIA